MAAGLRDALRVGTERTVEATSGLDGFLANELIRIALPDELDSMARTLRRIGLGSEVDRLEVNLLEELHSLIGDVRHLPVDVGPIAHNRHGSGEEVVQTHAIFDRRGQPVPER